MAVVAVGRDPRSGKDAILGVARLSRLPSGTSGEFAVVVRDAWQGRGVGKSLVEHLIEMGRAEGIRRMLGYILPDNTSMQRLCERLGFHLRYDVHQEEVRSERMLTTAA